MKITYHITLSLAVGLAWAASAQAVTIYDTNVDVYEIAGPQFISGAGIPINGFAQDSVLPLVQSPSVALKARDRDTGQANAIVGNRYFVDPGFSTVQPAITNLAVDFQFDPGADGVTNYVLRQTVDFDPAYGATDFVTITLPIFDVNASPLDSWDDSDGFFANPGGGAWNDSAVPYVISNSTRLDFGFWNAFFGKTYDPNSPGEYEFRLEVLDPTGSVTLAGVTAFAVVVPEPASIAMVGIALCGFGFIARRRRRS